MTILVSPGVDVSVVDESFYASAGPGTVPLVFIATRENKPSPGDSTSYASGSLKENANTLYLITSQRELIQTFGEPEFVVVQGTPVHGSELSEWGLHAAYSYLGNANRAYIIRADVDLGQLEASTIEPSGSPLNGTYWFDTGHSVYGIFRSNGEKNVNAYSDWSAGTTVVVDTSAECEIAVYGTEEFASTTTAVISGANPNSFNINGTTVTLLQNDTVATVISKINVALTGTSVSASASYTATGVRIKIRSALSTTDLVLGTFVGTVQADLGLTAGTTGIDDARPDVSKGDEGDFAVVTVNNQNRYFEKRTAQTAVSGALVNVTGATADWYLVGTAAWAGSLPSYIRGDNDAPAFSASNAVDIVATFWNGSDWATLSTTVTSDVSWNSNVDNIVSDIAANLDLAPYVTSGQFNVVNVSDTVVLINNDGGALSASDAGAVILGIDQQVTARRLYYATHLNIPSNSRADDVWVKTTYPNDGVQYLVKLYNDEIRQWVTVSAPFYEDDAAANDTTAYGSSPSAGVLYVSYGGTPSSGYYFEATQVIRRWTGTAWEDLAYEASVSEPRSDATEGQLWYNTDFKADIMVSNGTVWQGLNNHTWYTTADVILSGSRPTAKPTYSDVDPGGALVTNDIWIDTSELENYPKMYRYNADTRKWTLIDNTDQTTPNGIVFADARQADAAGSSEYADLVSSNYVDPDAPNPLTYPNGMLLFNTRASTYNVKEWQPEYLFAWTEGELAASVDGYEPGDGYDVGSANFSPIADDDVGRWVTKSGNKNNGAPYMGRKAQRQVIVIALQAAVASNEDARAETVNFNLLLAPGYVELLDELATLNVDKKQTAFIIGDTPARLAPTGTDIQNWALNTATAAGNGEDGLVTSDTYTGIYYPWGLGTNIDGYDVLVPPSSIALRTIAYSDQVSYPWFAPAGFNRGLVYNATSVGYLDSNDEYKPVYLNQGQRDVLYTNKINPIAFMPGQGLVVWGEKSRHPVSSALDRINVDRLINYLRYQFDILAKPYLFEPNDKQTRDGVRVTFERALAELIALRALYDFAVICDESNNTPERIDRNELWVDVAIKPVKVIEFIYIPIRILNTGDQLPGGVRG